MLIVYLLIFDSIILINYYLKLIFFNLNSSVREKLHISDNHERKLESGYTNIHSHIRFSNRNPGYNEYPNIWIK